MTQKKCLDGLNRGPWQPEEDMVLKAYIDGNGVRRWSTLPKKAGLMRCGKSCRLRWMNHLRPKLKRGRFSADEEELIIRLHKLLGNRWSLIAARVPGRTDSDIKNFWNNRLSRKLYKSEPKDKPSVGKVASESSEQFSLHTRVLNFQIDSIASPVEPKRLEHPYNDKSDEFNHSSQEPTNVYSKLNDVGEIVEIPATANMETSRPSIDTDSFWFDSLPWLGFNEDDKIYCDDITSYFTDVEPFLSLT